MYSMIRAIAMSVQPLAPQLHKQPAKTGEAHDQGEGPRHRECVGIVVRRDRGCTAQHGPKHPAVVERKGRDQVGQQQDPVPVGEPAEHPDAAQGPCQRIMNPRRAEVGPLVAKRPPDDLRPRDEAQADRRHQEQRGAGDGPGQRDQEVLARSHLERWADQVPQRPEVYLVLIALEKRSRDGVPQFVQRQRQQQ